MANIFDELSKEKGDGIESKNPPPDKVVDWMHQMAGTSRREDVHHRIGYGPTDAAAGDHTHNGVDSKALWTSADVTLVDLGATPTTAEIVSRVNAINAALRKLGAG